MQKLVLLIFFFPSIIHAQQNYWQQQVNFKINVQLNDQEHTLDGFAKIEYINHSPDTLRYIWFHLWPNAYRTDRTAFSDQLLENGRTDFYFSNKEDRGYINRLDFRVNNTLAKTEDHPQHIDIIKLLLPEALAPGAKIDISTPFHVKLPKNFSRGGHIGQSYQITQWYPKPAVYDHKGWHPMPYLDQGEFYSEFGNYEVQITVPEKYVVLSSGNLQNEDEKKWLKERNAVPIPKQPKNKPSAAKKVIAVKPVAGNTKTLIFTQQHIHDFAWFADKNYSVLYDTLQLANGKTVDVYAAYYHSKDHVWKNSIQYIKDAVRFRSNAIGEYPYNTIAAVEAVMGFEGGMEYPCITSISPMAREKDLEGTIQHEVGHNWFQGMLANNEQQHAWFDEGVNSFYDDRFEKEATRFKPAIKTKSPFRFTADDRLFLYSLEQVKKDQPLNINCDSMIEANYFLLAYTKGAAFMKLLEDQLGRTAFDSGMQLYFSQWKLKHVYPENLQATLEQSSGKKLDSVFALLNQKGPLLSKQKKTIKMFPFVGTQNQTTHAVIVAPFIGANMYDGLMIGAGITNYTLAPSRFQYLLAPMYGTKSKQWNGAARLSYTFFPNKNFNRITGSLSAMKFSTNDFIDTANQKFITGFLKITPSIKFVLKENNPKSTRERFAQWKTYLITEDNLRFRTDTFPNGNRFTEIKKLQANRYLNQLKLVAQNTRVLYPYRAELLAEQAKDFIRLAFTGNYYFNYNDKTGADVRFFAGKFFYLGGKTISKQFQNDPYHFNLTGPKGYEDYTYSNYFIGRSEFEGFASQQIMMRDGGFKVRTDLLADKIGKTDDWMVAMNFVSDIPDQINILNALPVRIPVKVYADIGTTAEMWKQGATGNKLLYNAGLQVSLLKNTINVYFPLLYSKVYKDYFLSTIPEKRFQKNISFSIDIQHLSLKKIDRRIPF